MKWTELVVLAEREALRLEGCGDAGAAILMRELIDTTRWSMARPVGGGPVLNIGGAYNYVAEIPDQRYSYQV